MDATSSVTSDATLELRDQIGVTRRALNQKIGHLEGEVRHVVDELSHAVSDTISAARRAVSPVDWVRSRPFLTCAGALCVGVWVARRRRVGANFDESETSRRVKGEAMRMVVPVLAGLARAAGRQAVAHVLRSSEAASSPTRHAPRPPAEG